MSSTGSGSPLRVLHLEDDDVDSELIGAALKAYGLCVDVHRVQTASEFAHALTDHADVILSDFSLPGFSGLTALQMVKQTRPNVPFILVSGTIGEERAVAAMKLGASDYVLKDHLERLGAVIERAVREAQHERTRQAAEHMLADVRQRMEFALEAAEVGVWEWDIAAGLVSWSSLSERLHGFASGMFPGTFEAFISAVHADDRERVLETLTLVDPCDPRFRVEYRIAQPDGSFHWVASSGQVTHDEGGHRLRASGVCYDISARRSLEEQLRQAQRLESIGGLAAGVAHDFNNLLNIILGYSEILIDRCVAHGDIVNDLTEVRRAATSATALTRQLLAFSRKQILTPTVIDLSTVIRDTQKMMRRVIEENVGVEIRCATVPLPVKVDVNQIEQVMLNLVVNARDAMPDGGVVTIETSEIVLDGPSARRRHLQPDLAAGRYASLTVSDTGTGIPLELQARLFEPFFTTKERGRGTGLGLATVYGIVTQSGGQIEVDSELGRGTTFKIVFPLSDRGTEIALETLSPAVRSLRHQRILVVEDEPALQDLIRRMLAQSQCDVLLASSAEEAQQILTNASESIHVVLTDVVMSGQSGYVLAKWIKDRLPYLPVIYMTGYADKVIGHDGGIGAGTTLLQKPFSRQALVEIIERALTN
jgi:two-component system, cell cycle sensor histidine kinase and response regulator CckA